MKEYIYEHNPETHIFIDRYCKGVNPCGTYYSEFYNKAVSFSMVIASQNQISDVVYKITDSVSGLFYIGKTRWIKRRFEQHQKDIFKCIDSFKKSKSIIPVRTLNVHQEFAKQFIKNKELRLTFEILYWAKMDGITFHQKEALLLKENKATTLCINKHFNK